MENYSSLDFSHSNAHHEKHFYTYSHLTSSSRDGQIHFCLGLTNTQISLFARMLCVCVCLPHVTGVICTHVSPGKVWICHPEAPVLPETPGGACFSPGQVGKPSSALGTLRLLLTGVEKAHFQIRTLIDKKYLHLYFGLFIIQLMLKWFLGQQMPLFYLKVCIFSQHTCL